METRVYWRRWDVHRTDSGLVCHVYMVVQRARAAEPLGAEHDVYLLGQYGHVQRESSASVRWLLHHHGPG